METESILSGHSEYGNRMQNGHRTTPRPLPPLKGNIMYTILLLLLKCLLCAMEHKEIWCITKQFAPFHSFCTLVFICHCRLLLKCQFSQCKWIFAQNSPSSDVFFLQLFQKTHSGNQVLFVLRASRKGRGGPEVSRKKFKLGSNTRLTNTLDCP